MQITIQETESALEKAGYRANKKIAMTMWTTLLTEKPLLIEGAPGVGKTSLAQALAEGMGLEFIRVQMYDGLTDDKGCR